MTDLKLEHGDVFSQWERPPSHEDHSDDEARHAETLKNGCHIVVRARKIDKEKVAVFFGTYKADAGLIKEQVKVREGLTCAKDALDFGKDEAKRYAGGGGGAPADNHHQATPI
jgi:hypothetical protein